MAESQTGYATKRSSEKISTFSIRVPERLKKKRVAEAEREKRSLNGQMELILESRYG